MRLLFLGFVTLFLMACSRPDIGSASEVSARGAFLSYVTAINEGKPEDAAAYYDQGPDFHWIENGRVQYETGAEAAKALTALAQGEGRSSMHLNDIREVKLSSNAALISTYFDFAKLTDSGDTQFSFDGWMTVAMVKRSDGWKIAGGQTGPGKTE